MKTTPRKPWTGWLVFKAVRIAVEDALRKMLALIPRPSNNGDRRERFVGETEPMVVVDDRDIIFDANISAVRLLGATRESLINTPLFSIAKKGNASERTWTVPPRFLRRSTDMVLTTLRADGKQSVLAAVECPLSRPKGARKIYFYEQVLVSEQETGAGLSFADALTNTVERERLRIARELHDDIGQLLLAARMDVGLLQTTFIDATQIELIGCILSVIDQASLSLRRLTSELRSTIAQSECVSLTLSEMCVEFSKRFFIQCTYGPLASQHKLPEHCSSHVIRIVQEALSNVARHSGASNVEVNIAVSGDYAYLTITDDGVDFEIANLHKPGRFGFIGIKERAQLFGGDVTASKTFSGGCKLVVSIPMFQRETAGTVWMHSPQKNVSRSARR